MSEGRPTLAIDETQLIELAALLSRGEPIPENLAPVLAEIGRDPEQLARLEAHRAWWSLLGEASESEQAEPDDVLVILVHPAAMPVPRWEVLSSDGFLRPVLEVDANGRVRAQRFDIALKRIGAELEIQLRKLPGRARGIRLDVTTPEGELRHATLTDARGKARIPVGEALALRLVFRRPARSAATGDLDEI